MSYSSGGSSGGRPACAQCGAMLPHDLRVRFCGACGAPTPEPPEPLEQAEEPAGVARYREVLARFVTAAGTYARLAAAEHAQLTVLQKRLGISLRTHDRLVNEIEGESARELERRSGPSAASRASADPAQVRLFIDTQTLRHFAVGTRCVLRLKVENAGELALSPVWICADVVGGERPPRADGPAIPPGDSGVVPVWLVPTMPGFFELRGVLYVVDLAGARSYFRFAGVEFRIGAAAESAAVSIVNIDQSAARVIDNSHAQFAPPGSGAARGGLVGEGEFHPVTLRRIDGAEAGALCPELLPTLPAPDAAANSPAAPSAPGPLRPGPLRPGTSVRFTIRTERDRYEATAILAQGDLATIYDGRRDSDGARVVCKIADDPLDNDLLQAEVSVLRLLRSEPSPQLKHLPVVLDQLHTRDGRLGTVMEYIDGLDLLRVRERLPAGLPPRHLIWLMRRCLSVLGWAHSRGVLHGNLDPAHILCRAQDHNVWVIDWCYAIVNPAQTGQTFRCLNEEYSPPEVAARKPPLPSSDLYSLGKCMFYVLGGDPKAKTLPGGAGAPAAMDSRAPIDPMDERLQRFLQFCVLESPLSRGQDAWEAYRLLDRLRQEIWGPHAFVELTI